MRIWLNFMHRDAWFVHCLSEGGSTAISPRLKIAKDSTLLNLLRAAGATEETLLEMPRAMAQTGRGTVAMDVARLAGTYCGSGC